MAKEFRDLATILRDGGVIVIRRNVMRRPSIEASIIDHVGETEDACEAVQQAMNLADEKCSDSDGGGSRFYGKTILEAISKLLDEKEMEKEKEATP